MRNRHLVPEIRELLAGGRQEDLVEVLEDLHPGDAASILSELGPDEIAQVMSMLPLDRQYEPAPRRAIRSRPWQKISPSLSVLTVPITMWFGR